MQCVTFDLNLKNKAFSQYINHTFNSMVKFNQEFLYANNYGLFKEYGSIDNATNIASQFELIKTDFGIKNPKRIHAVYLGIDTSVTLTLTITVDDTLTDTYTITPSKTAQQRIRVRINRTLIGRYWSFKISGSAPFSVDSIDVLPVVLSEGNV